MKSVVVFYPQGNAHQNATMWEVLRSLVTQGLHVTVITLDRNGPAHFPPGVQYTARGKFFSRLYWFALLRVPSSFVIAVFFLLVHRLKPIGDADFVIGVDREGIIEGAQFARRARAQVFFLSFEIMFGEETSKFFKRAEIDACSRIARAFIQDKKRAELISEENRIPVERITLLPMGARGLPRAPEWSVRDDLGIDTSKRVALFMGSLAEWSGFRLVMETVGNWPHDWVLLVHSRDSLGWQNVASDYSNLISDRRVFVTGQPFQHFNDLGPLMAGIDVGLAFYHPDGLSRFSGRNVGEIGLSSGKISMYLRHGVPIISNVSTHYRELLEQYGCGFSIETLSELPDVLATRDFGPYRDHAQRLFGEVFDFENYERHVLEPFLFSEDASITKNYDDVSDA